MAKGPAFDDRNLKDSIDLHDTGLRVINYYVHEIDGVATRIDIKIGYNQYHAVFVSTSPNNSPGQRISSDSDLFTPSNGVIGCLNVKGAKSDILAALKELVADIESDA